MIELNKYQLQHVSSYKRISKREYEFTLKNVPGEPWKLRIKAVKLRKSPQFKGECSLRVRRMGENYYYNPSLLSENPDQTIYQSLSMFLMPEIEEIEREKSYRK